LKLWIGNIAPDTSDDEVRALLQKYGGIEVSSIERVAEDGSRPAAILEVAATTEMMFKITQRLNGLYWKGRSLTVQSMNR
jgi:RNA recognition motif-containing protein